MGWSRDVGLEPVNLVTCARHSQVKGTWNFTVIPEMLLQEVNVRDFDALAIPGGFEEAGYYTDAYSDEFLDIIRSFHDMGKLIASVCVGALPVARSGVLNGRTATTYHIDQSPRLGQLHALGVDAVRENIVVDENIITSCGPSTATKVAFILLEKLTSLENSQRVRSAMGFHDS
jgi:4-methyl-5(b-hydroxyethyl)-thiazole monophosphate biosynthesis